MKRSGNILRPGSERKPAAGHPNRNPNQSYDHNEQSRPDRRTMHFA